MARPVRTALLARMTAFMSTLAAARLVAEHRCVPPDTLTGWEAIPMPDQMFAATYACPECGQNFRRVAKPRA